MKYIIVEIQKSSDGTIAVSPVSTAETFFAARSTFHSICASAAISQVDVHTVVLLNDVGQELALESFNHIDPTPIE